MEVVYIFIKLALFACLMIGSLFVSVHIFAKDSYITVNTPEEFKKVVIEKMKNKENSFSINYTGPNPLIGPNEPLKMVENEHYKNTSFNYAEYGNPIGYDKIWSEEARNYLYNFRIKYFLNKEQDDYVFAEADKIIKRIITPNMNTEQKVRAIHQYVIDHVEYDSTFAHDSYSAYGALTNGKAVCEGYSLLMQVLFDKTNIPSYIVSGDTYVGAHAWNLVNIDGVWGYFDATWNDGSDPKFRDSEIYFNATTNQLINKGRVWEWERYPSTHDSPTPPAIDQSRADQVGIEVIQKNERTYLKLYNVNPLDTIVIYDENKKYLYREIVDESLLQNNNHEYEIDLSMTRAYRYDIQGKFYVTRSTQTREESTPTLVTYDFRKDTKPIPLSQISIDKKGLIINGPFESSGSLCIYDETGKLLKTDTVMEGDGKIYIPSIYLISKTDTYYISLEANSGKESLKTKVIFKSQESSKPKKSGTPKYPIIYLNGKELGFEVPAQIIGEYTMVPMRKIFEDQGAKVTWDEKTQTVFAVKGDTELTYRIGDNEAIKNGQIMKLPIAGQIVNGSTLVPLRFVSEALGNTVNWEATAWRVTIETN